MVKAGLYPIPHPSTLNRSIKDFLATLRAMQLSSLCSIFRSTGARSFDYSWGHCGNDTMLDSILTLEAQDCGLSMTELTNSREVSDGVGIQA